MLPKEYAFFLLKYRALSEKELIQRLKRKKFPEEEIKKVISFLKERGFIDDIAFAKVWVSCRLSRSFGLNRITQELKLKGINREVLEERIAQVKKDYCESKVIEQLARDRLSRLKNIEPVKARNRTYAYLIRRGFSPEGVSDTLNKICKQIY
ncbi:MAG: regulatory protein RecX [Candidatus Omnitrophica bacterium]|nr:regulatory protein RecX [Candidatus Omnitrophota bacterium]